MELLLERIRYKGTDLMLKNRIIRTKLIVRETTR